MLPNVPVEIAPAPRLARATSTEAQVPPAAEEEEEFELPPLFEDGQNHFGRLDQRSNCLTEDGIEIRSRSSSCLPSSHSSKMSQNKRPLGGNYSKDGIVIRSRISNCL